MGIYPKTTVTGGINNRLEARYGTGTGDALDESQGNLSARNAWEVLFSSYFSLYTGFSAHFLNRGLWYSLFLAITSGYWLQYLKDFNANYQSTMFF